jgi:hypothetical protein
LYSVRDVLEAVTLAPGISPVGAGWSDGRSFRSRWRDYVLFAFFFFSLSLLPREIKKKKKKKSFFFSFIWFTTAATYYWRVYVMFAMSILGLANAHRKDVEKRFPPPYSCCCCCCCWPFWLYKTETSGHDLLFVFCFV